MDEHTFEGQTVPEEGIEQGAEVEQTTQPSPVAEQVSQEEPVWRRQFSSPEQMYESYRRTQAERDRYEAQLRKTPTQPQPQQVQPQQTSEQLLNEFIADPAGFIQKRVEERVMPYVAKAEIDRYEATLPGFKDMKSEIREIVEQNPAILNTPFGLEMAYHYVKSQKDTATRTVANEAVTQARAQAEQVKRKDAFVEGATQPKRSPQAILKPGMSVEESLKALQALGIGDAPEDPYTSY